MECLNLVKAIKLIKISLMRRKRSSLEKYKSNGNKMINVWIIDDVEPAFDKIVLSGVGLSFFLVKKKEVI